MLVLDKQTTIHINVIETLSSLDESLHLIQRYLSQRLDKAGALKRSAGVSNILIDLGALGTKDHGEMEESAPAWKQQMVYPIRLYRSLVLLGPLYMPGRSDNPCPRCLERRWFSNRPKEEQMAFMQAQQLLLMGHNPKLTHFALESIWLALISTLPQAATSQKSGAYPFYVLNLESQHLSRHHLLQDSNCPVCATYQLDTAEAATLELSPRPKRHSSDYRLSKATDYDLPLSALVNPVTGVLGLTGVAEFTNTLASPVSGQFKVRGAYSVHEAWWSGHGNNFHQSLYLGMLEGLERYSGLRPRGRQIGVIDSYANLAPDALDPRECGLYQPEFYQLHPHYLPFTPERKLPWVWGYSFRRARPILVPEQLVYYMDYRAGHVNFVQDCSSGCATGSCLEEAILYGLLELIERDAFLLTWYARLAPARIDPWSCHRPETLFVLEGIRKQGYDLYLFDTRLDVRVPSVVGVARLRESGLGQIQVAAGCGMDAEDAIRGALCEIASYIPDLKTRVESKLEAVQAMARDFSRVKELSQHSLLYGLPEMASRLDFLFQNPVVRSLEETYRDWRAMCPQNEDLRDDVLFCIQMIMELHMDVIVVDQTCPEQANRGLRTVCVIVPGLLPMDFGWKRERIFDLPRLRTVPRTAGFRETDFVPDMGDVVPHPFP